MRVKHSILSSIAIAFIAFLGVTGPAIAVEASGDWQVRAIPTPVNGVTPSFISADGNLIAWTGAASSISSTHLFDLSTGRNTVIPPPRPGSYYNPCISGFKVAFQGGRLGVYDDVFVYDAQMKVLSQITSNEILGGHDWDPRVSDNRVVWEKNTSDPSAKPGLYLRNLSGGTRLVVEGDDYRNADLWGDYLVCVKNVDAGSETGLASEILLFDLSGEDPPKSIADKTRSNEHPRISMGKVVWCSAEPWTSGSPDPWLTSQIHVYDMAAETDTALTNNTAGNLNPTIEGDLVAWEIKEPSSIVAYDLGSATAIDIHVPTDQAHSPDIAPYGLVWYGNKGLYTAVPPENATRFPDVPNIHVYFDAIEGAAEAGVIEGFINGYFGPETHVTRQQFAKMIVVTRGLVASLEDEWYFTDGNTILHVDGELYAYHYVARAALSGLVKGYTDGSFRPSVNISREQVITMIVRAGGTVLTPPPNDLQGCPRLQRPDPWVEHPRGGIQRAP